MMKSLHKCFVTALLVSLIQAEPLSSSSYSFASSRPRRANPQLNNQLPDDIIPVLYNIKLNLDFDDDIITLNGNLEINITVKKTTNEITMHAKNLIINPDADLECTHPTGDVAISVIKPIDNRRQSFKMILSKKLHVGTNCTLKLNYTATFKNDSTTMVRSRYTNKDGVKKFVLVSRPVIYNVLPYWKNINLRTTFIISIEHKKNYIALSNMDAVKYDIDPQNSERIITHFSKSINMRPSEVAFAIGEFIKNDHHDNKFRIWTLKDSPRNLHYAQEVGPKLLRALDDYTNFPYVTYKMNKVDFVVTDFREEFSNEMRTAALSECGFINFLEYLFPSSENSFLYSQLESVTQTIAHELAHQWFGCLINGAAQKYAWLNEGFSNYLEYVITDQIQPTWRMMDKFVTENIQSGAFKDDSKINSLHMEQHKLYDLNMNIYRKSGSIIRMISYILGEEKFKLGFRNYVKTKAFGSVTSNDFFAELTNVYTGNINLTNALKNWVTTPGYAVITVKRNYDVGKAIITQSRFMMDTNGTSDDKYWIPINFVTEENLNFIDTNVTHWFDPSMDSTEIDQLKKDQFIICNKQLFGYYRVNYDNQNWKLITNYLNSENYSRIHVLNRAQLIDDAFSLVQVGQLDHEVVLSLLSYLKQETDIIPWSVAWKVIEEMYNIVENTEIEKYFKEYILELSEKIEREVLFVQLNETDSIMSEKRRMTLKWTCSLGSSSCRSEATKKLISWLEDSQTNALSADEIDWVICTGLRNANQTLWDKLWNKYLITKDINIILALSCSSNVEILKGFIVKYITEDSTFEHVIQALYLLEKNISYGVTVALDFLIEHFNEIIALDKYTADDMQSEVQFLAREIKTNLQRDKLKIFIDAIKASIKDADNMIAAVDKQLQIRDEKLHGFKNFFKKYMTKNSDSSSLSETVPENNTTAIDGE